MTAVNTSRRHIRPAMSGTWKRPAAISAAGAALLLAAWLTGNGPVARKPHAVEPITGVEVVVPARDRAAINDWCSFFSSYGLRTTSTDERIARPTLLHRYKTDSKLSFPKDFTIEVFFDAPQSSKANSDSEQVVSAKLRELREKNCDRGI